VIGVDIAPSMVAQARALDREGQCQFIVNERADLSLFPDQGFDFIYSNIVLQHMRPVYSTGYIREFCRVLTPGGVAVFQVPSLCKLSVPKSWKDVVRPLIPSPLLRWYRHRYRGLPVQQPEQPVVSQPAQMEMYTVPKSQVLKLVKNNGCRLVDAVENTSSGPSYESWRYCMVKR
jgi:ubiquinone/menaquinone biosynthesis C-methylase UbiE